MTLKRHPQTTFIVIAADPESDFRLHRMDLDAVSSDEARRAAREELATMKRDHWSIRLVRERRAA